MLVEMSDNTHVDARLCPGTLANVLAMASLLSGARGLSGEVFTGIPARRAAALDIRGWIEGVAVVDGTGRARNWAALPLLTPRDPGES